MTIYGKAMTDSKRRTHSKVVESDPSFGAGIEVISIDQVPARVYSPEKTIADRLKYQDKIWLDVAIEALRTCRERMRKPDFRALSRFAQINRVGKVMRPYIEAIL